MALSQPIPVISSPAGNLTSEQFWEYKRFLFSKIVVDRKIGGPITYMEGVNRHPIQPDVHFSEWENYVFEGGRRSGKTICGGHEGVAVLALPDTRVGLLAPNYNLTDRCFFYFWTAIIKKKYLGDPSEIVVSKANTKVDRHIELIWGSSIYGMSAKAPDSIIGDQMDLLIVDEAARVPEAIIDEVTPALQDREGRAFYISSPRGKNHFSEKRKRGGSPLFPGWSSGVMKSIENPLLSPDYIAKAKSVMDPVRFRREFEASEEDFTGTIWPMFKDQRYIKERPGTGGQLFFPETMRLPDVGTNYRAIDIGYQHPTCCLWFRVTPNQDVYFYREYVAAGIVHDEHAMQIATRTGSERIQITWGSPDAVRRSGVLDPQTKQMQKTVSEVYSENGIHLIAANDNWKVGITTCGQYLKSTLQRNTVHPRVFISSHCPKLREGILRYRFKETSITLTTDAPEAPHKKRDDEVDAFRYGLVHRPRFIQPVTETVPDRDMLTKEHVRYGYNAPRPTSPRKRSRHRSYIVGR